MMSVYETRIGRAKVEVRSVEELGNPGVLLQVGDEWHLVMTTGSATVLAMLLTRCVLDMMSEGGDE